MGREWQGYRAAALGVVSGLVIAAAATAAPPRGPQYHLTELGRPWGSVMPSEVSDDGTVVGRAVLAECQYGNYQRAAVIYNGIGNTTVGPVAPDHVDAVCADCDSEGLGIEPGGNLAVGAACEQSDVYNACQCNLRAAVWERQGDGTWVRSWIEPPSLEPKRGNIVSRALGVARVGGAWIAVGRTTNRSDSAQLPAVWRESGGTWSRENLPLGTRTSGGAVAMNEAGLVAGYDYRGSLGQGAIAWDCSVAPCDGPYELPISGFDPVKVGWPVAHINAAGDVVGRGIQVRKGKEYTVAVLWPFTGTVRLPWGAPVVLPDFGESAWAHASEPVSGVLTVVGHANSRTPSREGNAVRWRRSGTMWSAPERLAPLDDARVEELGGLSDVELDISGFGQITLPNAYGGAFVESPNF